MSNDKVIKDICASKTNIINKINKLPHELVDIIRDFLPKQTIVWLTRNNYFKYHTVTYSTDSLVRNVIRNDHNFVFAVHLTSYVFQWMHRPKYVYKNKKYNTFFDFIKKYVIECEATKCRNILSNYINTGILPTLS